MLKFSLWILQHSEATSCQTTKWCSRFPFMHSAAVCHFVQMCKIVCFPCVCLHCACASALLPGVLFKLCINAWLTSQHTSRSLPAMTSQRHRWDLKTPPVIAQAGSENLRHAELHGNILSHGSLGDIWLSQVRVRCCITWAGQLKSSSHDVSRSQRIRMLDIKA